MNLFKRAWLIVLAVALLFTGCTGGGGLSNDTGSFETKGEGNVKNPEKETKPQVDTPLLDAATENSKYSLSFRDDGSFKVMILSDVQSREIAEKTRKNIRELVDREDPDLVIFNGDNSRFVDEITEAVFRAYVADMVEYLEEKNIPWVHTFGNHDAEDTGALNKEKQQAIYESFEWCLSQAGPEEITGVGNFVLPVYSPNYDGIRFAVWCLDSNMYTTDASGAQTTDCIHQDQIDWYAALSHELTAQNGGSPVYGLMAFHIPLQETRTAWEKRFELDLEWTGEKREKVYCSNIYSNLFPTILECGDIKAIANGHDHRNDFAVKYEDVWLTYSATPSIGSYHDTDMLGARVFVIHEDQPDNITTYMSYVPARAEITVQGAQPISSGTVLSDFDHLVPRFKATGLHFTTSDEARVDEISVMIAPGKGLDGSAALAVTREKFNSTNVGNNLEVIWNFDQYGKIGDNRYVVVWVDLKTNQLDFRKASFGFFAGYENTVPYRTADSTKPTEFYYLAEGSSEWVTLRTGSDGCFGAGDSCSVQGYRGWFAFPIEYMLQKGTLQKPTADTVITGFYLYMCLKSADMAGKYVYFDDVQLVSELF